VRKLSPRLTLFGRDASPPPNDVTTSAQQDHSVLPSTPTTILPAQSGSLEEHEPHRPPSPPQNNLDDAARNHHSSAALESSLRLKVLEVYLVHKQDISNGGQPEASDTPRSQQQAQQVNENSQENELMQTVLGNTDATATLPSSVTHLEQTVTGAITTATQTPSLAPQLVQPSQDDEALMEARRTHEMELREQKARDLRNRLLRDQAMMSHERVRDRQHTRDHDKKQERADAPKATDRPQTEQDTTKTDDNPRKPKKQNDRRQSIHSDHDSSVDARKF
jgi:hypothetical protein